MKNIFTFTVLIFLIGCAPDSTTKYFDFEDSESETGLGVLKVGLRGEFTLVDSSDKMKITHKGSPYELWVWFRTKSRDIKNIKISNIEISYKDGELIKKHNDGDFILNWNSYVKAYDGGWNLKGLYLNHIPLQIKLKVTIINGKEIIEKDIAADLGTEYREEQANSFWSMLMSV